jgi:predicted Zn-dependent peptidase
MNLKLKRKVLKNGMTLLFEKRNLPVVTLILAVRNGTANESEDEKGISHFIEHMLYKGTKKRDYLKIAGEIEKNGGILNGFTSEDTTAFWCKIPSEHFSLGLDVLTDMFKNSVFDEKEFEKERKVILEELRMNKDNPRRYSMERMMEHMYEKPFGKNDDEGTMNSITRDGLVGRFKEVFQPDRTILCAVGNADFNGIVRFAEKNFKGGKSKARIFPISGKNRSGTEKRKGIDQASVIFGFHTFGIRDRRTYAAQILNELMAVGLSSRLFVEIRQKRNLAYAVSGIFDVGEGFGHNMVYVGTRKEHVEKVKRIIVREFEKVSKELDEKELKEMKAKIIGSYKISMEDSERQAMSLLKFEVMSNARDFYEFEKNIDSVRLRDVRELAGKAAEKHSFFALLPG